MSPKRAQLNPNMFFLLCSNKLIVWDYKNHNQFELNENYFNCLLEVISNGVITDESIYQELLESKLIYESDTDEKGNWEWDILSKIFHIGTSDLSPILDQPNREIVKEYIQECSNTYDELMFKANEYKGDVIDLPVADSSVLQKCALLKALLERKTSRTFTKSPVELLDISTILYYTFGAMDRDTEDYDNVGLKQIGYRKTSPSGGGMHPSEAYLFAFNIVGLEPGIYHYQAYNHKLCQLLEADVSWEMKSLLNGQYFSENLSAGVCITSRFDHLWKKYSHSRAYRIALMDIGHLSQTFQLLTTSLGYLTWLTGAFSDSGLKKILRIKSDYEYPLLFLGLGTGKADAVDETTKEFFLES